MTRVKNGHDFLHRMLAQPDDAEVVQLIEQLIANRVREDTWLDFKDGRWTKDVDKDELRRDITAFANSDGGCLVIGVSEPDENGKSTNSARSLAACEGDVDKAITQISDVCRSLAGQVLPAPREVRRVTVAGGDVLVLPILRSGRLAPVPEHGVSYYLRVGDGKARMPEYLLADVTFGRRQRPDLDVRVTAKRNEDGPLVLFDFRIQVENRVVSTAKELHCGAAGWMGSTHGVRGSAPSRQLLEVVDWGKRPRQMDRWAFPLELIGADSRVTESLAPFATATTNVQIRVPAAIVLGLDLTVEAALWIASSSAPPLWWQLRTAWTGDASAVEVEGMPRAAVTST